MTIAIRAALMPEFRHRRMRQERFSDFCSIMFVVLNLIGIFCQDDDHHLFHNQIQISCQPFQESSQARSSGRIGHSGAAPGLLGASAQGSGAGASSGRGWLRGGAGTPQQSIDADEVFQRPLDADEEVLSVGSQDSRCLLFGDPDTTPGRCRCPDCRLAATAHILSTSQPGLHFAGPGAFSLGTAETGDFDVRDAGPLARELPAVTAVNATSTTSCITAPSVGALRSASG